MEQLPFHSQWRSFARCCAQHAKDGIVAELDCGITVYWTQSSLFLTNAFFLSFAVSDEADLRQRLEAIKEYVAKAKPTFPWVLFIEPELLPADLHERSQEICLGTGFAHEDDLKCMKTSSLLPPVRPLPDAEIHFATSQQDVYDAMLLNMEAHDMDAAIAENVVDQRAFVTDFDNQLCCIVSIDGKPVSTATTLLLDECLYVAFVATSAQHRKVCFMPSSSVLCI